ncbi:MAG: PD40 domain-containing protein [Candidatus Eiseniibacteriota bacterium]|nr:MAG: PD40 domain-containing protein [Candidatus Eisenbacteria bacterium]
MRHRRNPSSRAAWVILVLLLAAAAAGTTTATAQTFGKNKVQYRQFDWRVASSENFEVYFYTGADTLASIVLDLSEAAAVKLSESLGHRLQKKIPIIIYESHYDFEQTNVTFELLEEGVGGFTEIFKNRVVIPFTGSYEELRHVLVHELTHAFLFDMMYGGILDSILSAQYLFQVPLWFMEGLAEYESLGWDGNADMIMRDAAISGYALPLEMLGGGYLVYKQGQSAVVFLVERYGREKLRDVIRTLKTSKNLDRVFETSLGVDVRKFSETWLEAVRKQYWPEVAVHQSPSTFGRRITDHKEDGSFLNLSPAVSPRGDRLVFLSDRDGHMDIYLASAIDGKILRRLVRGEKSMRFEVIPSFRSALAWSADERQIAFVAKSGKGDVLYLLDVKSAKVVKRFPLELGGAAYPSWSPDGSRIVLTGLSGGRSDLYLLHLETGALERLTDDLYDDIEAAWSPDGTRIAFSSDRHWPFELRPERVEQGIGNYSVFAIDPESGEIEKVVHTGGSDRSPTWSPDGARIIFTSSPEGISNLYAFDLAEGTLTRLTDVLGGAFTPDWSAGDRLAFTLFSEGGWDVYVAKEPLSLEAVMEDLAAEGRIENVPLAADTLESLPGPYPPYPLLPPLELGVVEADTLRAESDSLRLALAPGSLAVAEARRYKIKFSPDWITGGFQYTSAFGFGGNTEISLSDFLGNHRFYIASDFFSSVEETDVIAIYYYLPRRLDLGVGAFHYKSYYYSRTTTLGEEFSEEKYFSDRNYGFMLLASYPFGKFQRVDFDLTHLSVDRVFYEYDPDFGVFYEVSAKTRRMLSPGVTFVGDTVKWGIYGPASGSRWAVSYSSGLGVSDESMTFQTSWADLRKYIRVAPGYSFAFRVVGAFSEGEDAQRFFTGGPYTLRGYEDFEFVGTRVVFVNSEFRFPFIDRLGLVWPLPVGFRNIKGVLFFDIGAAWSDDESFKPFTRVGGLRMNPAYGGASLGTGLRTGLSFIILKVDFAWRTDFDSVSGYRTHVSIGGEF